MDKTIIQQALGFNPVPVNVMVTIDGQQIFEGPIPTAQTPGPMSRPIQGEDAWSWSVPGNFVGTQTMTVTVQNGLMFLLFSFINMPGADPSRQRLHHKFQGEGFSYYDPLSDVEINGITKNPPRSAELNGQWGWALGEGDVFSCTVNISIPGPA